MNAAWRLTVATLVAGLCSATGLARGQVVDIAGAEDIQFTFPASTLINNAGEEGGDMDDGCGGDSACKGGCGKCDDCACCGGWLSGMLPCNKCCDEPHRLLPDLWRGLNLYGWVDAGITYNADGNPSHFNGPVTFNDRDDGQVNQVYVILEKPIDPDCCGWQVGGRADLLFGTDARYTQAIGLELDSFGNFDLNRGRRFYHLALPQFYVELARGDLSVIVGHFYTIIGYEVVPATGNFFYSHAYTMQYGEPFTHSGFLASYQLTDTIEVKAGMHNGWDIWDRSNTAIGDHQGFLGSAGWTSCDERASVVLAYTWGRELDGNIHDRHMYSLVATYQVSDRLQYVIQHDNGWQVNSSINEPVEWYGINQYLFYTINDCWKAGLRAEWFRDDDGVRVGGLDLFNPTFNQSFSGHFYEVTLGMNWTPCPNITVRPELRWDWFEPGSGATNPFPYGEDAVGATEDDDQFLAAIDVIVAW